MGSDSQPIGYQLSALVINPISYEVGFQAHRAKLLAAVQTSIKLKTWNFVTFGYYVWVTFRQNFKTKFLPGGLLQSFCYKMSTEFEKMMTS